MRDGALQLRWEFKLARYLLGVLILTPFVVSAMFVLPPVLANVMMLALSLVALRLDRRFGLVNPVTYVLIATAIGHLATHLVWPEFFEVYFFPTIIFSTLFVVSAGLLLIGQPFTNFMGTSLGDQRIHFATSIIWTIGYFVSALVCLAIPNMPGLYFVPPVLVTICAALSLWLQVRHDPRIDIGLEGKDGDLVRRLPANIEAVREMYHFYVSNLMSNRRDRAKRTGATGEEIAEARLTALTDQKISLLKHFVSQDEKGIKGSIYVGPEVSGRIRYEEWFPKLLDLSKLRRFGRTAEIGFFAIRKDARRSRELPMALIAAGLTQALALNIKLLVINAYPDSEPLYRKLGCEVLTEETVVTPEGFPAKILFLNLERRISEHQDDRGLDTEFRKLLDTNAVDLFVKRAALRSLFFPRSMKNLLPDEIRRMAAPVQTANSTETPRARLKADQT